MTPASNKLSQNQMFWHHAIRLYVLMIPLVVYDLVTSRRIHPATMAGTSIVVTMHWLVSALWNDPSWNQLAMQLWMWIASY